MFDIYHEVFLMDLEKIKLYIKEIGEGGNPEMILQQK